MSKPVIIDIAAAIRQMGAGDFSAGCLQSEGRKFWGPNSLALQHWVEGWERAQIDAWCDEAAMKDTWAVEQFKKALGL
jgi:hypothetical protein